MPRPFPSDEPPRIVGRYALFHELASGGMATVHLGRLLGSAGFSRTVAVKRLHAQHAKDPDFVAMLLDEARLAARIHHPNVVATLDVVAEDDELFLVMDYVHGESLARLLRITTSAGRTVPVPVAVSIIIGMLHGLHAAHEAKSETGEPLDIVHRDMSPQNVIVGADGVARVLDFGVAKAANRVQTTQDGQLKGKLRYMSPEQLRSQPVTRASDIFSAAVVAYELLTGQRFVTVDDPGAVIAQILADGTTRPSLRRKELDWVADEVLLRGLKRDPQARYATALEFAVALEKMGTASLAEVSTWVKETAAKELAERAAFLRETETRTQSTLPPPAPSAPPPRDGREHEPDTQIDARSTPLPKGRGSLAPTGEIVQTVVLPRPSRPSSQYPSQHSSISVTASVAAPAAPMRRRALALGALFLLVVAMTGAGAMVIRARNHAKKVAADVPPTPASTPIAAVQPPPVADVQNAAPPAVDAAAPALAVVADAAPPRPASGTRGPRRNPVAHPPPPPTADPSDIRLQR